MNYYYPDNKEVLYYVEFERGDHKGEFTLFKRHWLRSKEELEKIKMEAPTDFLMFSMTNEGHPWNIFTADYGPLGTMPDENWVKFMVDSLNRQAIYLDRNKKTENIQNQVFEDLIDSFTHKEITEDLS